MVDAVIRPEEPIDHLAIAAVVGDAFGTTSHPRLVDELRRSAAFLPGLALVAVVDDEVVGHVMVTRAVVDDGSIRRPVGNLSPLAVAPSHQGQGIGRALVREVLARADRAGEAAVVLEGDPAFYGRLGFEPAAPWGITIDLPGWAPLEAAQVARLSAWDPSLRGGVVYPEPFAALGERPG